MIRLNHYCKQKNWKVIGKSICINVQVEHFVLFTLNQQWKIHSCPSNVAPSGLMWKGKT